MPSPTKKNAAFTIILPILDADGDLVPAGATLTSVIAGADGVALLPAFAAGPVPVDEGEGFYSIELTASQMNFDRIAGVLKTTTAGAKNTPFTIYTSVRQIDDLMPTYTQPTGFLAATFPAGTVANTTNVTAATGVVLSGVTHTGAVIPTVSAVTGLTAATVHSDLDDIQARLPAALTAGGNIKADALAWNGLATVALPATPTNITAATGIVLSGVTHTGAVIPTVSVLTGHTAQTGDNFARIGATGSGLTSLASQASVNAVDDFVDTEIGDIQARLPAALVGGRMDSNASAINGIATSAARLARSTQGIVLGTVGAASTTTSIVTSALDPAAAVIYQYKGRIVTFDQGTATANLRGQSTDITANTAAGVLTVTALSTAPVSGDTFTVT